MDVTNRNLSIPGVNSATNFKTERAFLLDFGNLADIGGIGVHDLVKLPAGEALVGLRAIAVTGAVSGGAATVQFGFKLEDKSEVLNSEAIGVSGLGAGYVYDIPVNGVVSYGECILQMTVGGAALTGGQVILIAESIPVDMFVQNG